jgi:hypothetical protein
MQNRLGEALGRFWTSVWRRRGPIAVKTEHDRGGGGLAEVRGRFWREFREGQRQAEVDSARLRQ